MFEFLVGMLAGSILTVMVPKVFIYVSSKVSQVKSKL